MQGLRFCGDTSTVGRAAPPHRPSIIVLAGGKSRRFGRDKLAARVGGQASLARVLDRVRPVATTVRVSVSSDRRRAELRRLLRSADTEFIIDRPERWGPGPGGAIARALTESEPGPVLIVPGDMPWLETAALGRLLAEAQATGADVVAPRWGTGETEHLLQWHRDRTNVGYLPPRDAWVSAELRASELLRAVPRTALVPVGRLSTDAGSFGHLTVRADLERPTPRGVIGRGSSVRLVGAAPKRAYRDAHAQLAAGDRAGASASFRSEAEWYARADVPILARHARTDADRIAREVNRGSAPRRDR